MTSQDCSDGCAQVWDSLCCSREARGLQGAAGSVPPTPTRWPPARCTVSQTSSAEWVWARVALAHTAPGPAHSSCTVDTTAVKSHRRGRGPTAHSPAHLPTGPGERGAHGKSGQGWGFDVRVKKGGLRVTQPQQLVKMTETVGLPLTPPSAFRDLWFLLSPFPLQVLECRWQVAPLVCTGPGCPVCGKRG